MAAGGRGRGRGRGAIFLKDSKPGGLQASDESKDELASLLEKLKLGHEKSAFEAVVDTASKQATQKESLEDIMKAVYHPCYTDWKFSRSSAQVCQRLAHIEVDGVKFRDTLLRTVQSDFKNKDSLRTESDDKFVGFVAFLAQSFDQLRGADGIPFKPLIGPILQCFEMMLDGKSGEKELECLCEQLLTVGVLINKYGDSARLNKLKPIVRDKILDTNISKDVRSRLIDVLEAYASNWSLHLPNSTS